jgi:pimeloyl-ACP methyl ester carboxylesterase
VRNSYTSAMRARILRCRALYVSLFTFLSLAAPAQNPAPQSPAAPASAPSVDSNNAAYRKLDQILSFIRERNARDYAIDPVKGVDEASYVSIGGIEQWVTIRGQDRRNPVLLFLHGGPGDVTSPWSFATFAPWEANFTVVQWDQRGAGRTLSKSGPSVAPTMTLDRMSQDGIELAEYLCKHLGKPKAILVAHSLGTVLGLSMIRQRPDLLFAYVGTGQVADETRNYAAAYDALLKKAQTTSNQQALDELKSVGPSPNYPLLAMNVSLFSVDVKSPTHSSRHFGKSFWTSSRVAGRSPPIQTELENGVMSGLATIRTEGGF